jgi:hypothetical protein
MDEVIRVLIWIAAGIAAGTSGMYAFWRLRSIVQVWRAPVRPLHSVQAVIWRDRGDVSHLDLAAGPGGADGAPRPPFTFIAEHLTGSQPCVSVRDARGLRWRIKWGDEVNSETLATRLAWAAGYFVETTYFIAEGKLENVSGLQRAAACVDENCRFRDARFELDEAGVTKHFEAHSWAWTDVARGSNTAIFEYPIDSGMREARYLITDWGATFGRWGSVVRRGRWDCHAFAEETAAFVSRADGGFVRFGYTGQRTGDIAEGIRVSDVRWFVGVVGGLRESQIADAVRASGGTPEEIAIFSRALRTRLDALAVVGDVSRAVPA